MSVVVDVEHSADDGLNANVQIKSKGIDWAKLGRDTAPVAESVSGAIASLGLGAALESIKAGRAAFESVEADAPKEEARGPRVATSEPPPVAAASPVEEELRYLCKGCGGRVRRGEYCAVCGTNEAGDVVKETDNRKHRVATSSAPPPPKKRSRAR